MAGGVCDPPYLQFRGGGTVGACLLSDNSFGLWSYDHRWLPSDGNTLEISGRRIVVLSPSCLPLISGASPSSRQTSDIRDHGYRHSLLTWLSHTWLSLTVILYRLAAQAGLSIVQTLFICFAVGVGAMTFSKAWRSQSPLHVVAHVAACWN